MAEPKSHRVKQARFETLLPQTLWAVNSELSCVRRRPTRAVTTGHCDSQTQEYRRYSEFATRGVVLRSETLMKGFMHIGVEAQKEKGFTYD